MNKTFHQIRLILWKNYLVRRRQKIRFIFELLWPILLFLLLVWVRSKNLKKNVKECHLGDKLLPSAGFIPFAQNWFCTFNYTCHSSAEEAEAPFPKLTFDKLKKLFQEGKKIVHQELKSQNNEPFPFSNTNTQSEKLINFFWDTVKSGYSAKNLLRSSLIKYCDTGANSQMCLTEYWINKILTDYGYELDEDIPLLHFADIEKSNLLNSSMADRNNSNVVGKHDSTSERVEQNSMDQIVAILMNDRATKRLNDLAAEVICGQRPDHVESKSRIVEEELDLLHQQAAENYDDSTSEECNYLFNNLTTIPKFHIFWNNYQHLVLGKVIYTPVTPTTNLIMKQVNQSFFQIDGIKSLFGILESTSLLTESESRTVSKNKTLGVTPINSRRNHTLKRNESNNRNQDEIWDCFGADRVIGVNDEGNAEELALNLRKYNKLWALVIFESELEKGNDIHTRNSSMKIHPREKRDQINSRNATSVSSTIEPKTIVNRASTFHPVTPKILYKIRMVPKFTDDTKNLKDDSYNDEERMELKYINFGFAYLQDMIDRSIIALMTGVSLEELPGTFLRQYPYPCYVNDSFIRVVANDFPFLMVLAWLFTFSMMVKDIVQEKETRLKQTMEIMGLRNSILWFGWFVEGFIIMSVSSLIVTIVIKKGNILTFTEATLIFVFLIIYCLSTISLAFLVSTFFSKANVAAACGGMLFFLMYLPYAFVFHWFNYFTPFHKAISCLLSNTAFGLGSMYVADYERQVVGAQWDNVDTSPLYNDGFSLLAVMMMLLVDCFLYLLLTWYIESVFPGEYGVPLPWNFFFTSSYWLNKPGKRELSKSDSFTNLQSPSATVEDAPADLTPGVEIKNLTKIYRNGKVAVHNLTVNFYENQITAFLGHNGSGKTTTIALLTGLHPPTSGTAIICGFDVKKDMTLIHKNLGVCPQYNVLFNKLTVLEHLKFYGFLRGGNEKEVYSQFEGMLTDLNLQDKRQAFPLELSGGMRRKLSVALAFIGGSKVVILDEPTSGVDPYSRRAIWELLLKYKKGRTVILTTHYMDEADLLGDRVAIISKGSLKCSGSRMFLKNQFGSGFTITVELEGDSQDSEKMKNLKSSSKSELPVNEMPITKAVRLYVPNAVVVSKFNNEITFSLPIKDGKKLESLCTYLDDNLPRLEATSYGVSDTPLEEVFINVTEDDSTEKPLATDRSQSVLITETHPFQTNNRNKCVRQFYALHVKRFHHFRRNVKQIVANIVFPPLVVIIMLFLLTLFPPIRDEPPIELTPSHYGKSLYFFTRTATGLSKLMNDYKNSIYDEYGLGTRCLFWNGTSPCNPKAVFFGNSKYVMAECSCTSGAQNCALPLDEPPPPYYKIVSNDTVYQMDNISIPAWIITTKKKYKYTNFGGFEFGVKTVPSDLQFPLISGLSQISRNRTDNIRVWFNKAAWISSVSNLNAIHNNLLRVYLSRNAPLPFPIQQYGIVAVNHPMTMSKVDKLMLTLAKERALALLQAVAIMFALSFVIASCLLFLIEERTSNSKHLQFLSGVHRLTYWLQVFSWDLMAYMLSVFLCIVVFLIFNSEAFIAKNVFPATLVYFFLFGWSCIPLMYLVSFFFTTPSSAFVVMACANLFIGLITTTSVMIFKSFPDEELKAMAELLSDIFLIFPQFCFGNCLIKVIELHGVSILLTQRDDVSISTSTYFKWHVLGRNMFSMFVIGIICFLLMLVMEFSSTSLPSFMGWSVKTTSSPDDEDDVALERERVYNNPNDLLVIKDLTKKYCSKPTPSVNRICIGVDKGECLGLLGLNGAGKSTTFKMLTGATAPTKGDAIIGGFSIRKSYRYQTLLGYCPQFDAIDPLLTPQEHLTLYARIHNIQSSAAKKIVDNALERFALIPYRNKLAGDLSGGNKRKLSAAIALLANPPLICLDEPTTGMDPKAKRFLWTCIKDIAKSGSCVILTSHSMEECQALCSRFTIMVNGRFTCLGSSQHLKAKYGKGYLIILRCSENSLSDAKEFMKVRLSNSKIVEEHHTQLRYEVSQSKLSGILRELETAKTKQIVLDYSVTQTSLEEVFIRFAQQQGDPDERSKRLCRC